MNTTGKGTAVTVLGAVEPADLPEIRRLIEGALREGVTRDESSVAYLMQDICHSLDQWVAAPADKLHIKYVDDGAIAGVVLVKDWWNLTNLFVEPHHQRRGIGRALVGHVLDQCRGRSPQGEVRVNSSTNAVPFYLRLGFVPAGEPRDLPGGCVPLRYEL